MSVKFSKHDKVFGSIADKFLQINQSDVITGCNKALERLVNQRTKAGFVTAGKSSKKSTNRRKDMSILAVEMNGNMRLFAISNNVVSPKTKGVGGTAIFKPMRELIPSYDAKGHLKQVSWAPIKKDAPLLGFKRVKVASEYQSDPFTAKQDGKALAKNAIKDNLTEFNILKQIGRPATHFQLNSRGAEPKDYIIGEYYPHGDLWGLEDNPTYKNTFTDQKLLAFVEQLVAEVVNFNRAGLIHRDIKGGNYCIDKNFRPKLIDFGFVMSKDKQDYKCCGTTSYMAPEINPRTYPKPQRYVYDEKTEAFAVGKTIQELVPTIAKQTSGKAYHALMALAKDMVETEAHYRTDCEAALEHIQDLQKQSAYKPTIALPKAVGHAAPKAPAKPSKTIPIEVSFNALGKIGDNYDKALRQHIDGLKDLKQVNLFIKMCHQQFILSGGGKDARGSLTDHQVNALQQLSIYALKHAVDICMAPDAQLNQQAITLSDVKNTVTNPLMQLCVNTANNQLEGGVLRQKQSARSHAMKEVKDCLKDVLDSNPVQSIPPNTPKPDYNLNNKRSLNPLWKISDDIRNHLTSTRDPAFKSSLRAISKVKDLSTLKQVIDSCAATYALSGGTAYRRGAMKKSKVTALQKIGISALKRAIAISTNPDLHAQHQNTSLTDIRHVLNNSFMKICCDGKLDHLKRVLHKGSRRKPSKAQRTVDALLLRAVQRNPDLLPAQALAPKLKRG